MAERRGDAHVQMARELAMNPATLGTLDNPKQEPWKLPLPRCIEELDGKRFGKSAPGIVMPIEERDRLEQKKTDARRAAKPRRATEAS